MTDQSHSIEGLETKLPNQAKPQTLLLAGRMETRGLINAARIARMKPDAVIINVGRGPVVDETALYAALSENRFRGAVIDVWYQYPTDEHSDRLPSRFPLEKLDNIIMTPHSSASTNAMRARRWRFVAENLNRFAQGESLRNVCFEGTAPR